MLRWRAATALVLAPIALGAIILGKWSVLVVVLLVVAVAAYELSRVLEPLPFVAALGAGPFPSSPFPTAQRASSPALLGLPWALLWLAAKTRTLKAVLAVLLMTLWVGAPLAHLGLFPRSRYGVILILIAVVGPWISDSGAYFAGRFFGRRLLFPSLSPNKTVGAASAVCCVRCSSSASSPTSSSTSPLQKRPSSGRGSLSSPSAEIFESMLKRILDVKDLGHFLPGHGGILDRVDSLLLPLHILAC